MSVVNLNSVDLTFQIRKDARLKDILLKQTNKQGQSQQINALSNLNLTINAGERVGIIGHNGAGKSSLLKLIAGIYPPTGGNVHVDGSIACLFELATGFEMEATGWDNIYLRGLMLGEHPKSIKNKTQEIADFSGLGEYLNVPVKYYSSGMFMRLAFSISTAIKPDILLLDEVIAAGDAAFLEKAEKRMKELMGSVKILVFVTHSMKSLKDFCNKCIWLDKGQIRMIGGTEEVSQAYLQAMLPNSK
ncbi:ABC transporter ATP-binding protein [Paenibacillus sp. FSL F4-0125]|uniref:ABC transporter ATP-binding protein n=1 Tax=Paenibacillus sp. FSL F4-0125 TaxID=2954730 RepID=UPI0030FBA746